MIEKPSHGLLGSNNGMIFWGDYREGAGGNRETPHVLCLYKQKTDLN